MDPDDLRRAYQRVWMDWFLNRRETTLQKERQQAIQREYEIECLKHMWALPEREEP